MEHQSLITTSTSLTGSDGSSIVIKQEPKDSYSQTVDNHSTYGRDVKDMDISIINIMPIIGNVDKKLKIEDTLKVKPEFHREGCALFEASSLPAVKCDYDSKVCDGQLNIKIVKCESLKTGIVQDIDPLSQLREVSGAIDCKDGIISKHHGKSVDVVLQTGEKQNPAAQRFGDSGINEDIKREGWYNCVQLVIFYFWITIKLHKVASV